MKMVWIFLRMRMSSLNAQAGLPYDNNKNTSEREYHYSH